MKVAVFDTHRCLTRCASRRRGRSADRVRYLISWL